MLKNIVNYKELLEIFRKRNYYDQVVWSFSLYHSDVKTFQESVKQEYELLSAGPQIFEYFPLSSNRAHKFMNQEKSTILNREFKETYRNFIVTLFLGNGA